VNALGWARDRDSVPALIEPLARDEQLSIRREAATALGRMGDERAVAPLLAALRMSNDAFLTHSLIYALIQINRPTLVRAGLDDDSPGARRGALLALGQMENAGLDRQQIAPLLRADEVELQRAAFSVAAQSEALQEEVLLTLREQLGKDVSVSRSELFREILSERAAEKPVQQLVSDLLHDTHTKAPTRLMLLDAIRQSSIKPLPPAWVEVLEAELRSNSTETRLAVISLVRERGSKLLDGPLRQLATDATQPSPFRLACLDAIAPRLSAVDDAMFAFVRGQLTEAGTPTERLSAARTLGALPLSKAQLLKLAERLPSADALILPRLLPAFARYTDDETGRALIAGLEKAPAITSTPATDLAHLLEKFPKDTQTTAKPLLARLGADLDRQRARLEELSPLLSGGDVGHGRQVFIGQKAACTTCHRVSGQGGLIGPNLSAIAEVRSSRDLLESVVYPSASIVQGYHPFIVTTKDGQSLFGILIRETPEAVWLRGADLAEVKVETSRIASMVESPVSLMPQGLDATLSKDELRDLLAFLQSLKKLSASAPER
jgi:putative heme-binding domain-containing protein